MLHSIINSVTHFFQMVGIGILVVGFLVISIKLKTSKRKRAEESEWDGAYVSIRRQGRGPSNQDLESEIQRLRRSLNRHNNIGL